MFGFTVRRLPCYPVAIVVCIAFAFYVRREALWVGFFADDYAQIEMLQRHYPVPRAAHDLFNFSDGSYAEGDRLRRAGFYPWWADAEVRLDMLRPLASLMTARDYAWFGTNPLPYHVHSALWWFAMLALVATLFRRALPPRQAVLAFVLFACGAAHAVPLWWISNRSVLVSTALGLVALLCYMRFRERGAARWLVVSNACYALALGFGEYAFCALPYLLAYEFHEGRGARRWLYVLPALALALGFVTARSLLHVTAQHSGMYIDPWSDPLGFARACVTRLPVFVGELLFLLRADYWTLGAPWTSDWVRHGWVARRWLLDPEPWRAIQVGVGSVALVTALLLHRFGLRPTTRRSIAWWVAGSLGSLLPVVGSFPSSRLLLSAAIGFAVWVSALALDAFSGWQSQPAPRPRRRLARAAIGGVLVACQVAIPVRDQRREFTGLPEASERVRAAMLHMNLDDASLPERDLVLVAAFDGTTSMYLPATRRMFGKSVPRRCMVLSHVPAPFVMTRESATTFNIRFSGDAAMLRTAHEQLLRARDRPFHRADSVELGLFRATILELSDGFPTRVRFVFARPLEDESLLFMLPDANGFQRFELPSVGESRGVPAPAMPQVWDGSS